MGSSIQIIKNKNQQEEEVEQLEAKKEEKTELSTES